MALRLCVACAVYVTCGVAHAGDVRVLDDGAAPSAWRIIASDGVTGRVDAADGEPGVLRWDYDFKTGAGFCVLRRDLPLDLPANYRLTLKLRGTGRPNNLEMKLIDGTGANVWWVVKRDFPPPTDWQTLVYRARSFRFAWGPSGGAPLSRIGAIELAVSAGQGGQGTLWLDELTFEELPAVQTATQPPTVTVSSTAAGAAAPPVVGADGSLNWHSTPSDAEPTIEIDWQAALDVGGLTLEWDAADHAVDYEVQLADDEGKWTTAARVTDGNGGRDCLPLPDAQARRTRVVVTRTSRGAGVGLRAVHLETPGFEELGNATFTALAPRTPRGRLPRYFLKEQPEWTVVGVADDEREALIDTDGAVEVDKLGFRLEPFVLLGDVPALKARAAEAAREAAGTGSEAAGAAQGAAGGGADTPPELVTWADVQATTAQVDDCLPIPSVTWERGALRLEVQALADGAPGASVLVVSYTARNAGTEPLRGALAIALRPFQVLPPWQDLNITGGVAAVGRMELTDGHVVVDGQKAVWPWTPPAAWGCATFVQGEIADYVAQGLVPAAQSVEDPARRASGVLYYPLDLAAGATQTMVLSVPFHGLDDGQRAKSPAEAERVLAERRAAVQKEWTALVNRVHLSLPPAAREIENTFRAMQAYIFINRDGPAIQPGSRTYERSWIRDGALTSTALLGTGHTEKVRAYLDWYAGYQFPSGKVPCVVDRRGPDPVPEHDSTGELLYGLAEYYRFTHDVDFLKKHVSQVALGLDYIASLRRERMTDEYRSGTPAQQACYGLAPESISHEGYSAKPMHSYWDDFFLVKGVADAAVIAAAVGDDALRQRAERLRDDFQAAIVQSIERAMKLHKIDYVPGCADLGDFDATSTTIALFPCGQLGHVPRSLLQATFDRYWQFFLDRRDGRLKWENYTPYEMRVVGAYVRLGQPERAQAALDFLLADQRPPAWHQWAEVVWRERATPRYIGDLPHTWVGSDFLNAVRSMLVYEVEERGSLVIAAGVPESWLDDEKGVSVGEFCTEFGPLSYNLRRVDGNVVFEFTGPAVSPPGGVVLRVPGERQVKAAKQDDKPVAGVGEHEVSVATASGRVVVEMER